MKGTILGRTFGDLKEEYEVNIKVFRYGLKMLTKFLTNLEKRRSS